MTFTSILTLAKQMRLNVGALACVASLLVGCASLESKAIAIEHGATRATVLAIMGPPQDRSFRGSRDEVLQYCANGFIHDDHLTVWLRDGKVVGMTTDKGQTVYGFCRAALKPVDWEQAPYDQ